MGLTRGLIYMSVVGKIVKTCIIIISGKEGLEGAGSKEAESTDITNQPLELQRSEISLEFLPPPPPPPSSSLPPPASSPLSLPSFWAGGERERETHLARTLCAAQRDRSSFKFTIQDSRGHIYLHVSGIILFTYSRKILSDKSTIFIIFVGAKNILGIIVCVLVEQFVYFVLSGLDAQCRKSCDLQHTSHDLQTHLLKVHR